MATPTDINPTSTYESTMLRYAQESRDASISTAQSARTTASRVHFIAVVVGIFAALSLLGMLIGGIAFAQFAHTVTSPVSTCLSLGGDDPSC